MFSWEYIAICSVKLAIYVEHKALIILIDTIMRTKTSIDMQKEGEKINFLREREREQPTSKPLLPEPFDSAIVCPHISITREYHPLPKGKNMTGK